MKEEQAWEGEEALMQGCRAHVRAPMLSPSICMLMDLRMHAQDTLMRTRMHKYPPLRTLGLCIIPRTDTCPRTPAPARRWYRT